jgi:hypothetical protein
MDSQQPMKPSKHVTEARAAAQRAKLDAQAETRRLAAQQTPKQKHARRKREPIDPLAKRRAATTLVRAIEDYLNDHEGGNHSLKTLQWHQTSLGLLRRFLEEEREITLVGEVDAPDISAWFAYLRKMPGSSGKPRTERTVQTYARSARAFFHWLVRRETTLRNPFERLVFPKVGRPLIRTIEPEEFERLLLACTPPGEVGQLADRAAARNRAMFWLLYDTGIRTYLLTRGVRIFALALCRKTGSLSGLEHRTRWVYCSRGSPPIHGGARLEREENLCSSLLMNTFDQQALRASRNDAPTVPNR